MKKEDFEQLGDLQKSIYLYLEKAVYESNYTLEIDGFRYDINGYVGATLTIGGYNIRVSINQKRYCCWHCDRSMEDLIGKVPHIKARMTAHANRLMRENLAKYREQRIKQLQDELKELEDVA